LYGKHGSPIQFFFTPYSILIAIMASTTIYEKYMVRTSFGNSTSLIAEIHDF
jgi:hypothetical protein